MVQIHQASVSRIASADFNGTKLSVFLYKGKPTALIATALELKEGEYPLRITLKDGSVIEKTVTVGLRPRVQKPLGIPEKLGGNTPASAKKLVSTLQKDNASLTNLKTQDHVLWTEDFALPLKSAVVTDTFGYQRDTIGYEIAHKGTDFRATTGSPVLAMNRGSRPRGKDVLDLRQDGRHRPRARSLYLLHAFIEAQGVARAARTKRATPRSKR